MGVRQRFLRISAATSRLRGSDQTLISLCISLIRSPWLLGISNQLLFGAANFVTGVIVAHAVSQGEYGLFALGTTIILLLMDVQAGLISTPQAIRTAGMNDHQAKSFTGSTLVHQLLISAFCAAIAGAVALVLFVSNIGLPGLAPMLGAIAAFAVFTLLREYLRRLCFIKGWLGRVVVMDGAITVVQLVALLLMYHLDWASATVAHVVLGVVCGCFALATLVSFRSSFTLSPHRLWPDFVDNFRIGGWLVVNNLLWTTGAYAYPWLLAILHGTDATAIWAACMSVISIMHIALAGILNVLTPNIANAYAKGGAPGLRRYVFKSTFQYVGVALTLGSVPILFGETIVGLVYGPAYTGTSLIILVLACNAVLGAVTGAVGRGLMVLGHAKADFAVNVGSLVFVFTVGLWGAANWGPLGAACSLTAANGLGTLLRLLAFNRISQRA